MEENRNLLVSFSGGETSAYMTHWILNNLRDRYDSIVVVFANTGEEREQTLEFIRDCDEHFGFHTVWIEGVQTHGSRVGPSHKVVTFETADRLGGPFEDSIKKYGISNSKFKDCTRNMKRKPIEHYARTVLKWRRYDIAIGIRADEIDRMSSDTERSIIYPFVTMFPRTKPQVNGWWVQQPFRLRLKGYQGNCRWCWKKSDRKHFTLINETPEVYDFPKRMEKKYGLVGPEFQKDTSEYPLPAGYHRVFFRGSRSTKDIFDEHRRRVRAGTFTPAADDHMVFDPDLDVGAGCEESCEVWSDE